MTAPMAPDQFAALMAEGDRIAANLREITARAADYTAETWQRVADISRRRLNDEAAALDAEQRAAVALSVALDVEDHAEDVGEIEADERITCHTHRAWFRECVTESTSHANPVTGFNWCRRHGQPVHECRCWAPNVTGRPGGAEQ